MQKIVDELKSLLFEYEIDFHITYDEQNDI